MTVQEMLDRFPLTMVAGTGDLSQEISGGYASDLLSNVMGQAGSGNVWVTIQGHQNIVAVASLAGLAAIIVAGGTELDKETIKKAEFAGVVLLKTDLPAFEVAGRLYTMGVLGMPCAAM